MSRNKGAVQESEATECAACRLIPIAHLGLNLDEPTNGWAAMFTERGIEVVEDDMLRPSILRSEARSLMSERRAWEMKNAESDRRRQKELVRESRPVPRGIPRPAGADPGLTAYEIMRGVDADAERSDPARRMSPQEEFLERSFGRPVKVVTEEE